MIAFISLFLGLAYGPQTVELTAADAVARVEIRLDGRVLASLDRAPWRRECDFGSEVTPSLLEAVAFDLAGREIGRASQWLNLPQPRAVANVVLEPRRPGEPRIAQLRWESSVGAEPESVVATLDGEPLTIEDPARIVLPEVDESELHLLQFELRFDNRVTSRVDVTFGGMYVDEVSTEITALPLLARDTSIPPPSLREARGWFLKDGEPLPVLAIEKESVEVVVVLDRAFPRLIEPRRRSKVAKSLYLDEDERFRFITTVPERSQGVATNFELFPMSPAFGAEVGDLYSLLSRLIHPPQNREPRPTSAVAVAGLAAYEGRHRRAVIFVPSSRERQQEKLDPARVRRYLGRLGVPLFVWDPRSRPTPHLQPWEPISTVSTMAELSAAFLKLSTFLERQWIVWIDGRHLPQDIELASDVKDFELLVER